MSVALQYRYETDTVSGSVSSLLLPREAESSEAIPESKRTRPIPFDASSGDDGLSALSPEFLAHLQATHHNAELRDRKQERLDHLQRLRTALRDAEEGVAPFGEAQQRVRSDADHHEEEKEEDPKTSTGDDNYSITENPEDDRRRRLLQRQVAVRNRVADILGRRA